MSFNLVAPTELEASQQAEALSQFSELVQSGKLDLKDLEGQALSVPGQCVQNCPVQTVGMDTNISIYYI